MVSPAYHLASNVRQFLINFSEAENCMNGSKKRAHREK